MKRKLYQNGTILTMGHPAQASSVLVEDGVIRALDADRAGLADVEIVDLRGRTMLPAFLDAHSHLSAVANGLLQCSLEDCADFDAIRRQISDYIARKKIPAGQWVLAKGYDHTALQEGEHPTLAVLDAAAPEHPLMLQHRSGHVGVVNSLGLRRLGLTPETPDPSGGKIGREDGKLTGYLEENAFLNSQKQVGGPDPEALFQAFQEAQQYYLRYGITTVQEGMLPEQLVPVYRELCRRGLLTVDVVGYADAAAGPQLREALGDYVGRYRDNFRLGGYKMFLDGSPQGRTAWMRQPYAGEDDYRGYPTLTDEQVESYLRQGAVDGMQVLAHCNGDAAAQQFLNAVEKLEGEGLDVAAIRPVLVHGQLLGVDQLDAVRRTGVLISFFAAHVYHWGDIHIRNFGMGRARYLTPARSALERGIPITFHQDTPVLPPDMLETIWCAAVRRTREGVQMEERIGVQEGLQAVTANTAYQYFEEDSKGTIAPGKRADFVVLDRNPLVVPPEELRAIRVMETVRGGETLYRAAE